MTAPHSTVAVTGGAGFIGSTVVRQLMAEPTTRVVVVDKLTYAANPSFVTDIAGARNCEFLHADIADASAMGHMFAEHRPDTILHLAAETHVDRSIDGPDVFFSRTSSAQSRCSRQAAATGWTCPRRSNWPSGSFTSRPMRSSVPSVRPVHLMPPRPTYPIRPTPPARRRPTTLPGLGAIRSGYR